MLYKKAIGTVLYFFPLEKGGGGEKGWGTLSKPTSGH